MNNKSKQQQQSTLITNTKNVPIQNVLVDKITIDISKSINSRKYIQQVQIENLAENKWNNGLTFKDIINEFKCKKQQAQRTIKHFHSKGVLFTNQDLIKEGIKGLKLKNTSPQKLLCDYYKSKGN